MSRGLASAGGIGEQSGCARCGLKQGGKVMKALAISLGLALAVTACTVESEEDQLENAIRNQLASQGNVLNVELTRQDDNHMNGFADIRDNEGREGRLNCSARRTEGTNFQLNCLPAVTEQIVHEMENNIRTSLAQQAELLQVDLNRQDDMRMTGHALVRAQDGTEVRAACSATRQDPSSRMFNWEGNPE